MEKVLIVMEDDQMENCLKCGAALEGNRVGRPKAYCSTACRRAAEMEIRRLGAMLEKLEEKASQVRQGAMKGMPGWKLEDIYAEIERAESRLKRLLAAGDERFSCVDENG